MSTNQQPKTDKQYFNEIDEIIKRYTVSKRHDAALSFIDSVISVTHKRKLGEGCPFEDEADLKGAGIQEYVERGGPYCPFCGSDKVQTTSQVDVDAGTAAQDVECEKCGREWQDLYDLVGISIPKYMLPDALDKPVASPTVNPA